MSRGLKSYAVGSFLSVSKETVVKWKNWFDPDPNRSEFGVPDLLAYKMIKKCIRDLGFSPAGLAEYNTKRIFNVCEADIPVILKNKILVLFENDKEIKFLEKEDDVNWWSDQVKFFALDSLLEEFAYELYFMGTEIKKIPSIEETALRRSA